MKTDPIPPGYTLISGSYLQPTARANKIPFQRIMSHTPGKDPLCVGIAIPADMLAQWDAAIVRAAANRAKKNPVKK